MSLTVSQYGLVYNIISLAVAAMLGGSVFFFLSRSSVAEKYRPALLVSGLVTTIACYHYFRIFHSWEAAYQFDAATKSYTPTGVPFNDGYRYMDWILTVPLLMVELVAVLALPLRESKPLLLKLSFAAFLMIALGYPGEATTEAVPRYFWGTLSTIPFVYILVILWTKLQQAMLTQPQQVRELVGGARLLILATWGFYPIAYLLWDKLPGASGLVGVQVGYSIADILAKVGLGAFIYFIASAKSKVAENTVDVVDATANRGIPQTVVAAQ